MAGVAQKDLIAFYVDSGIQSDELNTKYYIYRMINYLIQFLLICLRHKRSRIFIGNKLYKTSKVLFICLLYTSDAADD